MNPVGCARCFLPLAGLLFAAGCPDGKAQLRFDPPALEANRLRLSLHGETGSNYVIESSVNLTNWSFLFSGMATDGLVSFLHSPAFDSDSLFYRAHSGVAQVAVPINVQPRADTNATGGTLVTVDDGGDFTFFGSDGTRFSLTFPSNTIPDATLVSMTLVTNVSALPFSRGIIGAVRLEPEDLDIFGAGILEISFPTNIDWRQIVSFTCGNDGSDFYLTHDLVHRNYVIIPLTYFGTFGSCLATTQELAQVVGLAAKSNGSSRTIAKQDAILG